MNDKQIRNLLHHADAEALEKISTVCPAADNRTEKQLFRRFMQKIASSPETSEDSISVTYQVGMQKRSVFRIASGTAACAVILAVTGLAFLHNKPAPPSQQLLAAETTTTSEPEELDISVDADEDCPEETEPAIATGIAIDIPTEATTSVTETQTSLPATNTETSQGSSETEHVIVSAQTSSPTPSYTDAVTEPLPTVTEITTPDTTIPEITSPTEAPPELLGAQYCYLAWYDGFPYNVPVVLTSLQELENFYETNFFSPTLDDWDDRWIVDGISYNFKTVSAKYDDAFFSEHDLILVFWQTPVAEHCLEVTGLTADEWNNWTIHIKEYPIGFTAQMTSWCMFVETNKSVETASSLNTNTIRADQTEVGYDNDLWK